MTKDHDGDLEGVAGGRHSRPSTAIRKIQGNAKCLSDALKTSVACVSFTCTKHAGFCSFASPVCHMVVFHSPEFLSPIFQRMSDSTISI